AEFGSVTPAVQRLEGVLLGLLASVLVAGLWPRFPLADHPAPAPPPPPPQFPGPLDAGPEPATSPRAASQVIAPGEDLAPDAADVVEQPFRLGVDGDAPGHPDPQWHRPGVVEGQPHLEPLGRRDPVRRDLHVGQLAGRNALALADAPAD